MLHLNVPSANVSNVISSYSWVSFFLTTKKMLQLGGFTLLCFLLIYSHISGYGLGKYTMSARVGNQVAKHIMIWGRKMLYYLCYLFQITKF